MVVFHAGSSLGGYVAALIEGLHIAEVDACALCGVDAYAAANAVARGGEAQVVHVLVAEVVVGGLPACRHGDEFADVVFNTGKHFECAAVYQLLLVAVLSSVAVVVEVISGIEAQAADWRRRQV